METKKCSRCLIELPVANFKQRSNRPSLMNRCNDCENKYRKEIYVYTDAKKKIQRNRKRLKKDDWRIRIPINTIIDLPNEYWKNIPGFEGYYMASNLGRIKRLSGRGCIKERLVMNSLNKRTGYINANLRTKNIIGKSRSAHRYIALTFIPNPENKRCVNHKNGIKTDNRIENLEWCTHSENVLHGFRVLGRVASGKGIKNRVRSKPILRYSQTGELLNEYANCAQAALDLLGKKNFGGAISRAAAKDGFAYGFIWKFKTAA